MLDEAALVGFLLRVGCSWDRFRTGALETVASLLFVRLHSVWFSWPPNR
jgi:hypothetical protein